MKEKVIHEEAGGKRLRMVILISLDAENRYESIPTSSA